MRNLFLTGLALLLPAVLTLIILIFFVNLITGPFVEGVAATLQYYDIFNKPFLLLNGGQVLYLVSKIFVLIGLVFIIALIGLLGNILIVSPLFRLGDYIFHRIPLVNRVYKTFQDAVTAIFSEKKTTFSTVVLVPFPHSKTYNIGLITQGDLPEESDEEERKLVSVFVPGTPNPAMGFMLLFKPEQLIPVDMKVDEALKFVVSCGSICPKFALIEKQIPL